MYMRISLGCRYDIFPSCTNLASRVLEDFKWYEYIYAIFMLELRE